MHRRPPRVPLLTATLTVLLTLAGPVSGQSDEAAVRQTLVAMWDAIEHTSGDLEGASGHFERFDVLIERIVHRPSTSSKR